MLFLCILRFGNNFGTFPRRRCHRVLPIFFRESPLSAPSICVPKFSISRRHSQSDSSQDCRAEDTPTSLAFAKIVLAIFALVSLCSSDDPILNNQITCTPLALQHIASQCKIKNGKNSIKISINVATLSKIALDAIVKIPDDSLLN